MKKKITFQNILLLVLAVIISYRFTLNSDMKDESVSHADAALEEIQFNSFIKNESIPDYRADVNSNDYVISELCKSSRYIFKVSNDGSNPDYEKTYGEIMPGISETDNGRTVLHARKERNTAGWLCRQAEEFVNNSETNNLVVTNSGYQNLKLKPVMKINKSDYSPDDTTKVAAIITKNYLGIDIDTNIIRVNNFGINSYSGQYIQNYFGLQHPLEILGRQDTTAGLNYGRPGPGEDIKDCKVDFKVYWYGLVDVWFDKMIVDDARADELFGNDYSGNYDCKIRDASTLENYHYILNLIREEKYTTGNVLPVKYVMKIMHDELTRKNILPNGLAAAR